MKRAISVLMMIVVVLVIGRFPSAWAGDDGVSTGENAEAAFKKITAELLQAQETAAKAPAPVVTPAPVAVSAPATAPTPVVTTPPVTVTPPPVVKPAPAVESAPVPVPAKVITPIAVNPAPAVVAPAPVVKLAPVAKPATVVAPAPVVKPVAVPAPAAKPAPVVNAVESNVPDQAPPTIRITSPSDGANVKGQVSVTAKVEDDAGLKLVTLAAGENLSKEIPDKGPAAYTAVWDTLREKDGPCRILVTAVDRSGKSATGQMTVHVSNQPPQSKPPVAASS